MKLITEESYEVQYLTEEKDGKKYAFINGVFMEADVVNRNGRFYESKILGPAVAKYTKELVEDGRGWGELNHPAGPTINLDRVCVLIKEIKQDGSKFIGKAQIAETPMGNLLRGLLDTGGKLGVSSRALGTLSEHKNGYKLVNEDLRLMAVDVVADPSAPTAFVEGIMENVEWVKDPKTGTWVQREIVQEEAEKVKKKIKSMNKRQINEQKVQLFEDFIASLTTR